MVAALVVALILLVRFAVGGRWRAPTRRGRRSLARTNKQRTRATHQRSTTNTTATIRSTARISTSPSPPKHKDSSRTRRPRQRQPTTLDHTAPASIRSEEHTSELQSRGLISYAVF